MIVKELIEALREYPDDTNVEIYTERYNDSTFIERIESGGEGFVELVVNDDRWDMKGFPKDVSNGDVIKAMFPKEEIEEYKDTFGIVFERAERFTICEATFSKAWWNAKYKG